MSPQWPVEQLVARTTQVVVLVLLCAACGTRPPVRTVSLNDQARARYYLGMGELVDGNHAEAIQAFQQVARSPGYIKYAALARLRIGDALFLQEKFDAAIENYRAFTKQFEGDANVGYAVFRIGHAFYEQIPSEWFLAPPAHEREQLHVRNATRSLRRFVSLYPSHRLVNQAQTMLDECERKQYDHELYVARFYHSREKPAGVVIRLERAFENYPDLAATEDNYLMLAKAYAQTARLKQAEAMYQAYLDRFPGGEYRDQAEQSLTTLRSTR